LLPDMAEATDPAVGAPMQRMALGLSYNGSRYDGWQSQPGGRTVQDHLERALARFLAVPDVSTSCAGRTDAGVHGLNQVVHFDTPTVRPDNAWVRGTNSFLPPDVAVQWARSMPLGFHARADAIGRRYAYVLLESPVRPSVEQAQVGWVFRPLDAIAMQDAAQHLIGKHDFTSFRASSCQAHSPVKDMRSIQIARRGAYWRFEFEASAFLHHMIRNIMGCLIAIGSGNRPPQWMAEVLAAQSRDAAAPTFAPDGLYFLGPVYDASWNIPKRTPAFDWLP
jgi:tRNA pseudouridine38-40 synthase